jgi:hypothetical protein
MLIHICQINQGAGIPRTCFWLQALPEITLLFLSREKKNMKLNVALTALWRVLDIFGGLDVRSDMCHREALVLFTGAGRTFSEVLFALVECEFFSAI